MLNRLKNSCLIGFGNPSVEFENNLSLESILFGLLLSLETIKNRTSSKRANTCETTKIVLVFAFFEDVSFLYFYAYIVSTFISFLHLYCFFAYVVSTLCVSLKKQSSETDLLARLAQLLVKLGTEAADERLFKKLIYG